MFDKSKYIINYNHILNYLVDICFWNWYLIISAYLSNDICTSSTYDSVNLIYDDFLCMPISDLYVELFEKLFFIIYMYSKKLFFLSLLAPFPW